MPGFSSQKLRCLLAMGSPMASAPFSECQLHFSLQLCVCHVPDTQGDSVPRSLEGATGIVLSNSFEKWGC